MSLESYFQGRSVKIASVQTEVSQGYGASPSTSVFNSLKINFLLSKYERNGNTILYAINAILLYTRYVLSLRKYVNRVVKYFLFKRMNDEEIMETDVPFIT